MKVSYKLSIVAATKDTTTPVPVTPVSATAPLTVTSRTTRADKIHLMSDQFVQSLFEATGGWAQSTIGMSLRKQVMERERKKE